MNVCDEHVAIEMWSVRIGGTRELHSIEKIDYLYVQLVQKHALLNIFKSYHYCSIEQCHHTFHILLIMQPQKPTVRRLKKIAWCQSARLNQFRQMSANLSLVRLHYFLTCLRVHSIADRFSWACLISDRSRNFDALLSNLKYSFLTPEDMFGLVTVVLFCYFYKLFFCVVGFLGSLSSWDVPLRAS